jgi:hypothetical protein
MMKVSFDLCPDIRTLWAACKWAASRCAFNPKRQKTNGVCKFGRGVKAKSTKTNVHKNKDYLYSEWYDKHYRNR